MKKLIIPILVLAALLRFWGLGHDLPYDLEPTNAPNQDAFWYLDAAQAPADGSHVESVPSFDRPLWVAIARAWFALAGTGAASSQALSALLSTLGVLGVYLALARERPRAAALAALLLAASYPFAGMARTPLIYSPLAGLMALAYALHAREKPAARAAGWLVALALAGAWKSVAVVMLPGLALADLARADRRTRAWTLAAGLVAVVLALVAIGWLDPAELERNELRIRGYLAPDLGAGSWRRLVLAPAESGLLPLAPGLLGLAAIGATRWRRPVVLGAVAWTATLFLSLALLDYRPLRFYTLAGPPLAILAGTGAEALLAAGPSLGANRRVAPLVAGIVAANAFALFARGPLLALAAPLGVGAALLVGTIRLPSSPDLARPLAVLVLVLVLGLDLSRGLQSTPTTLLTAEKLVAEALDTNTAVLVGPYASSLAAGTKGLERRRAPALFGGPRAAEGLALATREGFTHVALDAEQDQRGALSSGFARLGAPPVLLLVFTVRGDTVLLYRFQGAPRAGYQLSRFETACEAADPPRALGALGVSFPLLEARAAALERLGRADEAKALRALVR